MLSGNIILSTILKHDQKVTTYKFALIRAINDTALNFPDLRNHHTDVAIPLRFLARFWVAYYWPFVKPDAAIYQGQRSNGKNDMCFRPELTKLRREWETIFGSSNSSNGDGFYLIDQQRIRRKWEDLPTLHQPYDLALSAITKAIKKPIQHAGIGNSRVFNQPIKKYKDIHDKIIAIPGTKPQDKCLIINADLWQTFQEMSLWIEALCIHEWCLFSEQVKQETPVDRGLIYQLLTHRPDNRRPLTWEHHYIDLLLMEGTKFICPWTEKTISYGVKYDLDHILPVSLYPINELWNLVPSDPEENKRKSYRLPSQEKLQKARPHFELAYRNYGISTSLSKALQEDVAVRFSTVFGDDLPMILSTAVVNLIDSFAEYRSLARF